MIDPIYRLEFNDVFEGESESTLIYLSKVSKNSLLKIIGFCNTIPTPNFDNFFSDPPLQLDIINRVHEFLQRSNINYKPCIISRLASLKLAETIFSNRQILLDENNNPSADDDINLFKAFLTINSDLNDN